MSRSSRFQGCRFCIRGTGTSGYETQGHAAGEAAKPNETSLHTYTSQVRQRAGGLGPSERESDGAEPPCVGASGASVGVLGKSPDAEKRAGEHQRSAERAPSVDHMPYLRATATLAQADELELELELEVSSRSGCCAARRSASVLALAGCSSACRESEERCVSAHDWLLQLAARC